MPAPPGVSAQLRVRRGREAVALYRQAFGGTTLRVLLIADDPAAVVAEALRLGAKSVHPITQEHGWRSVASKIRLGTTGRSGSPSWSGPPGHTTTEHEE